MDDGSTAPGAEPGGAGPRRIVVHAALFQGVPRLFALSETQARRAIGELASLDAASAPPADDRGGDADWTIVEQEADVIPVAVAIVRADDSVELRWTCPACGAAWSDEWAADDELPVLLLCDCDGTANTWCLGEGP